MGALRRAVGLEASIRRASRRPPLRRHPAEVWRRRLFGLLAGLLAAAGIARAALPWAARAAAERALGGEGWRASIRRVHVSLWRGSWRLEDLSLTAPGRPPALRFSARSVEISLTAPGLERSDARARVELSGLSLDVAQPAALAPLVERLGRLVRAEPAAWTASDGRVSWRLADGTLLEAGRLLASGRDYASGAVGEASFWAAAGAGEVSGRLEFSDDAAQVSVAGRGLFARPGLAPADFTAQVSRHGEASAGAAYARRGTARFSPSPMAPPPRAENAATLAASALAGGLDAAASALAPKKPVRRPRRRRPARARPG